MTAKERKAQEAIERIMTGLKVSEAEAKEIYAYDCAIDQGQRTEYDLPADKAKIAQKFAHAGTRKAPTVFKFGKKERKPNATKGGIIAELAEFLEKNSNFSTEQVEITNKERQIAFRIGENDYELTLVQKRKKE